MMACSTVHDPDQQSRGSAPTASESGPRTIFIIRHAEKPETSGAPYGVNIDGERSGSSLIPHGWQRGGALARLFDPFAVQLRPGLLTPEQLIAPRYSGGSAEHRTYETILPLAELLGETIATPFEEGEEEALAQFVSHPGIGVALISWEHTAIPTIVAHIFGLANPQDVPKIWCKDRFDVVWSLKRGPDYGDYTFSQIPQLLLAGDSKAPIPLSGLPKLDAE